MPDSAVQSHPTYRALLAKQSDAEVQLNAARTAEASLREELEKSRASLALLQNEVESSLHAHDSKVQAALDETRQKDAAAQSQIAVLKAQVSELQGRLQHEADAISAAASRSKACSDVQERALAVANALQQRMRSLRSPSGQLRGQQAVVSSGTAGHEESSDREGAKAAVAGDHSLDAEPAASSALASARAEIADLQANVDALTEMMESTAQDYTNAEQQCSRLREILEKEGSRSAGFQKLAAIASQEAKLAKEALEVQQAENG